jgi:hypothetical protein
MFFQSWRNERHEVAANLAVFSSLVLIIQRPQRLDGGLPDFAGGYEDGVHRVGAYRAINTLGEPAPTGERLVETPNVDPDNSGAHANSRVLSLRRVR